MSNVNQDKIRIFLKDTGIQFNENSVSFILTCPRCSKPKKLYIRKKDGAFICFRCANDGFKGVVEYALAELTSMSLEEVRSKIYNDTKFVPKIKLSFDLKDFWNEDQEIEIKTNSEVKFPDHYIPITSVGAISGLKYLIKERGLTEEVVSKYNIMFNPSWKTVVFPVSFENKLYGWQERSINNSFKYTLKGFRRDLNLMFQDNLLKTEHAVLTEGPIDALKAELCGGNVCSMGKMVSDTHINILAKNVQRVYAALDPDANKEIRDVCRKLAGLVEVFILKPPDGKKDLGECTFEEVFNQFQQAKKYSSQLFLNMG